MIYIGEDVRNEPLFEELQVFEDFHIYVPKDNMGAFALWREGIGKNKRTDLYKLQNPIEALMNISFVPEDIARAIARYDLTPYKEAVKRDMARREELSKHPNIKVNGLQKVLEARERELTKRN